MTATRRTLVVLLILLYVSNASATVITATRDTYIHSVNVNVNYGAAETLAVNAQSTALIWHDIKSVLPTGTTADQVVKATLHLFVSSSSPSVPGSIYLVPVLQAWEGRDVVYASRPSYPLTAPTMLSFKGGRNYYVTVDVTDIVKGWVQLDGSNYGVALLAADNSVNVLFDSKENASTSHAALLDITLLNLSTVLIGKSFAACTTSKYDPLAETQETCNCAKTLLYKFSSDKAGASCNANAELNSCGEFIPRTENGFTVFDRTRVISCCVCAPF